MSHKKEILNLQSQAEQHRKRAKELESRAKALGYLDALELYGVEDGQIVEYRGEKAKIFDWYQWIGGPALLGWKVNKDGSVSSSRKVDIYDAKGLTVIAS